jgi:hypothetical protein
VADRQHRLPGDLSGAEGCERTLGVLPLHNRADGRTKMAARDEIGERREVAADAASSPEAYEK